MKTVSQYLKEQYGTKVYKIALDGGFTCPNRDGTKGTGGCIFCSGKGSGDFAESSVLSVTEQIEKGKKRVAGKMPEDGGKYIAYFQAFTNTYAPVERLRELYEEAIRHPDVVILSVATRPDCLPPETVELLAELSRVKPVWVELGLQTIHKKTADYIRRGYELETYDEAVTALRENGIYTITHVILGLPGETREEMLETVSYVGRSGVQGIKLQLLHVLENTDLAEEYRAGRFETLSMDDYISLVKESIALLPEQMVIHRMTGDGNRKDLIAPLWSLDKKRVLNALNEELEDEPRKEQEPCADTIRFVIDASCDGWTVKQFLREKLSFTMHQISRIKYRAPGFLVNGEARWVNHVLHTGDELEFSLDDPRRAAVGDREDFAMPREDPAVPRVLYEDPYILIADKPAGMVSHPSHGHRGDSALSLLERGHGRLYLAGRLDKDTSGVILFAKHKETASVLAKERREGLVRKTYLAEVYGIPDPPAGTIRMPIGIAQEYPLKMKADPDSGKEAVTHYETVSVNENAALLRVRIEQGRTHQIRVHMAVSGHPLVGDGLYAPEGLLRSRDTRGSAVSAHLHAAGITLRHPFSGEILDVSAGLPEWAREMLPP